MIFGLAWTDWAGSRKTTRRRRSSLGNIFVMILLAVHEFLRPNLPVRPKLKFMQIKT
jgi:hypothetical protein